MTGYDRWLARAKPLALGAGIVADDRMIPSDTAGVELFLRNKRAASGGRRGALLCVHGSSYPAETAYDLPLDGLSFMDVFAAAGFDVWLVDVRGYGRSTRPPEMDAPAAEHPPIVRTDVAVRDVGCAVAFILEQRALERLTLIGWSWGTTLTGAFTAAHGERVEKLVLLAPQWLRATPSASDAGGALGAYRLITREAARERWFAGLTEERRAAIAPEAWVAQWADATFATDSWGAAQNPPVLRAPNGTVQDSREFWAAGRPVYEPSTIAAPVLLVHAEGDRELPLDMARAYFEQLTGAAYKRWVEIGDGTHSLILERCRWQVCEAVLSFLEDR